LAAIRPASSFVSNFRRRSPPRLILEIDISKLLSVVIADHETGVEFLDRPRRREAAGGHLRCRGLTLKERQPRSDHDDREQIDCHNNTQTLLAMPAGTAARSLAKKQKAVSAWAPFQNWCG